MTPIVDCYRDNGDGTLLGRRRLRQHDRRRRRPTPTARRTRSTRPACRASSPSTFATGTVHGAWRVLLSYDEIFNQRRALGPERHDAAVLELRAVRDGLPAEHGAAGRRQRHRHGGGGRWRPASVGAFVLVRFRRRLDRLADQPASADRELAVRRDVGGAALQSTLGSPDPAEVSGQAAPDQRDDAVAGISTTTGSRLRARLAATRGRRGDRRAAPGRRPGYGLGGRHGVAPMRRLLPRQRRTAPSGSSIGCVEHDRPPKNYGYGTREPGLPRPACSASSPGGSPPGPCTARGASLLESTTRSSTRTRAGSWTARRCSTRTRCSTRPSARRARCCRPTATASGRRWPVGGGRGGRRVRARPLPPPARPPGGPARVRLTRLGLRPRPDHAPARHSPLGGSAGPFRWRRAERGADVAGDGGEPRHGTRRTARHGRCGHGERRTERPGHRRTPRRHRARLRRRAAGARRGGGPRDDARRHRRRERPGEAAAPSRGAGTCRADDRRPPGVGWPARLRGGPRTPRPSG